MYWIVLMTVVVATLAFTIAFWLMVATWALLKDGNLRRFSVTCTLDEARAAFRNIDVAEERNALVHDLETITIPSLRTGDVLENGSAVASTLLNEGVAENRTAAHDDDADPLPGDSWLCDSRPVWFAAIQVLPTIVLALLVVLPWHYLIWRTLGEDAPRPINTDLVLMVTGSLFVLWSLFVALISAITVTENFRLGVKRFDTQLDGFLAPGLQFVLPWGLEQAESVSHRLAVWGPHAKDSLAGEFFLGGTAGPANPEPGRFEVMFLGYWPLEVITEFSLNQYRKGVLAKLMWFFYLNRYGTLDEVGQALAQIALPIISKSAREVEPATGLTEAEKKDPAYVKTALRNFLDRMPETAGKILTVLMDISREDRAGFLIRRVSITAVIPGPEFREMMQSTNLADVERYNQDVIGQATAHQWERFRSFLATIDDPAQRNALITMARQEIDRELYTRVGSGTEVLSALLAKFTAGQAGSPQKEVETT